MASGAFFYLWETVDFPITITADDGATGILNGIANVVVSFGQKNVPIIEKDLSTSDVSLDAENDIINVHLSQEDTGKFSTGDVQVQVNLYYQGTERDATAQGTIQALANLHRKVMGNGESD